METYEESVSLRFAPTVYNLNGEVCDEIYWLSH